MPLPAGRCDIVCLCFLLELLYHSYVKTVKIVERETLKRETLKRETISTFNAILFAYVFYSNCYITHSVETVKIVERETLKRFQRVTFLSLSFCLNSSVDSNSLLFSNGLPLWKHQQVNLVAQIFPVDECKGLTSV